MYIEADLGRLSTSPADSLVPEGYGYCNDMSTLSIYYGDKEMMQSINISSFFLGVASGSGPHVRPPCARLLGNVRGWMRQVAGRSHQAPTTWGQTLPWPFPLLVPDKFLCSDKDTMSVTAFEVSDTIHRAVVFTWRKKAKWYIVW